MLYLSISLADATLSKTTLSVLTFMRNRLFLKRLTISHVTPKVGLTKYSFPTFIFCLTILITTYNTKQ